MKIGIFGGRFDPPHVGHLIHAQLLCSDHGLDVILFVPSFDPPHKNVVASFDDRFKMTKIAISRNKRFWITPLEKQKGGKSYTVNTLMILKRIYKHHELYLIIGADEWKNFNQWKEPNKIMELSKIIVLPRKDIKIKKKKEIITPSLPLIDISSTDIRERIKRGKSIKYLVPEGVRMYILKNNLYKD